MIIILDAATNTTAGWLYKLIPAGGDYRNEVDIVYQ
jgi:hypothetical protein